MPDRVPDRVFVAVHRALTDLGHSQQFASAYSSAFVNRLIEYGVRVVPTDPAETVADAQRQLAHAIEAQR